MVGVNTQRFDLVSRCEAPGRQPLHVRVVGTVISLPFLRTEEVAGSRFSEAGIPPETSLRNGAPVRKARIEKRSCGGPAHGSAIRPVVAGLQHGRQFSPVLRRESPRVQHDPVSQLRVKQAEPLLFPLPRAQRHVYLEAVDENKVFVKSPAVYRVLVREFVVGGYAR